MSRPDLEKLATIECKLCALLIDVLQQYRPEPKLIWCQHDREPDLCQHPPLLRCTQARAEIALRFGSDLQSRVPMTSSDVSGIRSTFDGLTDNKSTDRKPYKKARRRSDW